MERPKIIDLLRASKSELAIFGQRVQQRNGKLQILVHPFFEEDLPPYHLRPRDLIYLERRGKFIRACADNEIPLLVFEETSEYHQLRTRLQNVQTSIYAIKTTPKTPYPEGEVESWDKLMDILRNVGARKIVMGGQFLFFFDGYHIIDPNKDNFMPPEIFLSAGCVGVLARLLWVENFQVRLSSISSPRTLY